MRAAELEMLLPDVIRRGAVDGSPLAALLAAIEQMHAPSESILADLPAVFDPLRTPSRFVSMLSRWVDLDRLEQADGGGIDRDRMRLLVASSAGLGRRRGTARGLLHVLTLATGYRGFLVDETVFDDQGRPRPFHIRVVVPESANGVLKLIRAIVEQEKPAHLTAEVVLGEAPDANEAPEMAEEPTS